MPFLIRQRARAGAAGLKLILAVVAGGALTLLTPERALAELDALPSAESVVDRILERAAHVAQDVEGCLYTYEQRTLTEELDAKGQVVKSTEKTYLVKLIQGYPFSRLIKIEGKDLSPAELNKENRREEEFRRKLTATDFETMARRRETWLTRELMDRYEYAVQAREWTPEGRRWLELEFVPRAAAKSEQTVQDRILGRLAGRLWVDEEEAEVARVEVRLLEGFSLGFLGILGSVEACDIQLERRMISEGCWINSRHSFQLVGRKLFSAMRLRSSAESSGFSRTPATLPSERHDAALGDAGKDCSMWHNIAKPTLRVDLGTPLGQNTAIIALNQGQI